MIDTGATNNFITKKFCDEVGIKNILNKQEMIITGIGNKVISNGEVELEIEIGNMKKNKRFVVTDELICDVILGNEFLKEVNSKIEYNKNIITIEGEEIPLVDKKTIVKNKYDEFIKPGGELNILTTTQKQENIKEIKDEIGIKSIFIKEGENVTKISNVTKKIIEVKTKDILATMISREVVQTEHNKELW
ncbi:hypothetical protein A0H76_690 [Hepatospora eriocheir]|uniref:Peptidase A2 domain-containing protein n=1 Tax=Hepatospora eriocheir TaxID=1081669 RepID=A0A1X0QID0_9MICR|nr:hypothetical protein A0H76_690 [Hepatospora eriocheir]